MLSLSFLLAEMLLNVEVGAPVHDATYFRGLSSDDFQIVVAGYGDVLSKIVHL